jgi:CheY-like chemotaxis protein
MALVVAVDDEPDILRLIERILVREGHVVITARDGLAALEAVRKHRPDLVISDNQMPRMTGLDLCRSLRADPEHAHVPVVIASGSVDSDDPRLHEAGVTDTLPKPYRPGDLAGKVAHVLSLRTV